MLIWRATLYNFSFFATSPFHAFSLIASVLTFFLFQIPCLPLEYPFTKSPCTYLIFFNHIVRSQPFFLYRLKIPPHPYYKKKKLHIQLALQK
ncbi:hypothetical protein K450DRAFT_220402 [Umbelopsis ramanniana AG]|uniref:Uncharacterized protein n=1 Tax=Umbelopsis ramanniana AG TaxID=1314678 RepID=A0AAD5EHC8_UMBRA|nr:uncharacterized protein K450DRAFT_220402 [Umbelopsis ramanniana AG]KAI8583881.1 hypothetical protein K450DRAFT_220402 [Umbelopsis ramanniana AG]